MASIDPSVLQTLREHLPADRYRSLVASIEAGPEPQGDWVARSRAFALFKPVRSAATFLRDSLRRRDLAGGRDLDRYDLEGLVMEAIDRVVDGYGLGEPTTQEDLAAALAPFVAQMDRALGRPADAGFAALVAREALDLLLNRHKRKDDFIDLPNTAYVHEHLVPGPAPAVRDWAFLLLEEVTEDGRRVVRARQEAVIFSVRMLDFDLAEMGEVLEALLERQLRNGRYEMARRTAEQGRRAAAGFAAEIRRLIHEAQRRPLALGYARRVAPVLDRAREHVDERRRRERELRGLAEELRFERVSADVDQALAVIDRELALCGEIYARLAEAIARAPIEHEAARARAFANRVAPGTWREPIDGLLVPMLRAPAPGIEAAGPELLRRLAPPLQPRLFDLASFVESAIAPPRPERALDVEEEDAVARRLPAPRPPFDEARAIVVRRVAEAPGGVWLSALVAAARGDRALEVALALVVHERHKRTDGEAGEAGDDLYRVAARGPRRRAGGLEVDDLLVAPSLAAEIPPSPAPRPAALLEAARHAG